MTVHGLENNYYLSGNDIWITVDSFAETPVRLQIQFTNDTTPADSGIFVLYPNPSTLVFKFNISNLIRSIQPRPNHITPNSLQQYTLNFDVTLDDTTHETLELEKYFIRGGRDKSGAATWNLEDGDKLIIGKWVEWTGLTLPTLPYKIQDSILVNYVPGIDETYIMRNYGCNYTIVKFRNSLGGYQYWVFETKEVTSQVKDKESIVLVAVDLDEDRFLNVGTEETMSITLRTKTPVDLQDIIIDLVKSPEVLIYDPLGTGVNDSSSWSRMRVTSNSVNINTIDRVYNNDIKFTIPAYINRDL